MTENDIKITVDEWSVTASETISTGDYENYKAVASVSGEFPGREEYSGDTRRDVKARLLAIHRDMQAVVGRACQNRVSDDENWGVKRDE